MFLCIQKIYLEGESSDEKCSKKKKNTKTKTHPNKKAHRKTDQKWKLFYKEQETQEHTPIFNDPKTSLWPMRLIWLINTYIWCKMHGRSKVVSTTDTWWFFFVFLLDIFVFVIYSNNFWFNIKKELWSWPELGCMLTVKLNIRKRWKCATRKTKKDEKGIS